VEPYYDRDGITIYHGDCLEVLPLLEQVDHVITDPPYEAEAHTLQRRIKVEGGGGNYGSVGVAALDFAPMTSELRSCVGARFGAIARRWVLVFSQVEATQKWASSIEVGGARYMRTQIWVKIDGQPQLSGDRPGMGYESIVTCHALGGRSKWNGGGRVGVYRYTTVKGGHGHMTEKPIELMRELVSLFTDPGELILDPFMGSGTTLRAAKDLGRRAIGIELEEKYCEIAVQRLAQEVLL
jgi:hypothetical protein